MAEWTTFFVEVPLATFSPVKTLNDLPQKRASTMMLVLLLQSDSNDIK